MEFWGYSRPDGSVGVRNHVLILPATRNVNYICHRIALAEQLRPSGDDDVPQFLFFHGYPSNRFKIAKFSLLAAYSFRKTRKFRS